MVVPTAVWFKLSSEKVSHLILYRLRNAASLSIGVFYYILISIANLVCLLFTSIDRLNWLNSPPKRSTAFFTSSPFFSLRVRLTSKLSFYHLDLARSFQLSISHWAWCSDQYLLAVWCAYIRIQVQHSFLLNFAIDSRPPWAWFWDSFSFGGYWHSRIYYKICNPARISLYSSRSTN